MLTLTIFFSFTVSASAPSSLPLFLVAAAAGFLGFFSTLAVALFLFDGDDLEVDAFGDPDGGTLDGAIAS